MKSFTLLPNRFKRIGFYLFPAGLLIWVTTQLGFINLTSNQNIKVLILTLSFFSFLFGLFFSIFSKEPIEDEYINNIRLKSFQISSIVQMIYFLMAFSIMFILQMEPERDGGLSLFFILSIVFYWMTYLIVFNFTLLNNKQEIDD